MFLHNTLTGKKEEFTPMVPGKVGLYVCGITPYDETHLGHARCYVVFDLLKRALRANNYKVTHIQNFTDVDDKIIDRANKLGISHSELSKKNIDLYFEYMDKLNVTRADQYPLVTQTMKEIVDLVQVLINRGMAYELDGSVYYSVRKFPDYGKLSKRNIDDLEAGARVDVNEKKKDPLDFALWKAVKPGEPSWPSPWGAGRPGWHIECSAMSVKYLGEEFDIHGGGMDLIFPHHTNEVAQSVGASGKKFAHVWVHNGFVTIDNEKMSKSLGNFFTLKDILAKFDAMAVRYFLLSQHYRSPLNFSDHALQVATTTWAQRIMGAYQISKEWGTGGQGDAEKLKKLQDALNNDLNTPDALAELNQFCTEIYEADKTKKKIPSAQATMDAMFGALGLVPALAESWSEEIWQLAKDREAARKNKEWKRSDELRDQLKAKGVLVEDSAGGQRLKKL